MIENLETISLCHKILCIWVLEQAVNATNVKRNISCIGLKGFKTGMLLGTMSLYIDVFVSEAKRGNIFGLNNAPFNCA